MFGEIDPAAFVLAILAAWLSVRLAIKFILISLHVQLLLHLGSLYSMKTKRILLESSPPQWFLQDMGIVSDEKDHYNPSNVEKAVLAVALASSYRAARTKNANGLQPLIIYLGDLRDIENQVAEISIIRCIIMFWPILAQSIRAARKISAADQSQEYNRLIRRSIMRYVRSDERSAVIAAAALAGTSPSSSSRGDVPEYIANLVDYIWREGLNNFRDIGSLYKIEDNYIVSKDGVQHILIANNVTRILLPGERFRTRRSTEQNKIELTTDYYVQNYDSMLLTPERYKVSAAARQAGAAACPKKDDICERCIQPCVDYVPIKEFNAEAPRSGVTVIVADNEEVAFKKAEACSAAQYIVKQNGACLNLGAWIELGKCVIVVAAPYVKQELETVTIQDQNHPHFN